MTPDKSKGIPPHSGDELQQRLRDVLQRQRPRRTRVALIFLLPSAVLVGLLIWVFFPRGEPPLIVTTALDDLAVAGKETTLQGYLEAPDEPGAKLGGRIVVFADGQMPMNAGRQSTEIRKQTGSHGDAACPWTFLGEITQGDFIVSQVGGKFFAGSVDHGLVFLVPAATPVCLVQIEETLSPADAQAWNTANVHDIPAAPGAAQALADIAGNGYQLVYLTLTDHVTSYQRMRGWLRQQCAESRPPFPAGPVVCRFHLPWAEHDNHPWHKSAERLAQRFPLPAGGPPRRHLALAGTGDVAKQFYAAGWRTVFKGMASNLPEGLVRAGSWPEVAAAATK